MASTTVTFPGGAVSGTGTVRMVASLPAGDDGRERVGVVVDATPFHPVDHAWPDQPADRGTLAGVELADCVTGVVGADGTLRVGDDIRVKRGEPGWDWVVVHVVPAAAAGGMPPDEVVELAVDVPYRAALSRGHTGCHVAALALNRAIAPRWAKPVERTDSLGRPDFDQIALTRSRIGPDGAVDRYRLGKSIRRKGLPTEELLADLPAVGQQVDALLAGWVATGGAVAIECDGATLDEMRRWTVALPDGTASIPCGGTHVTDLIELGAVSVGLEPSDEGFDMVTTVTPPRPH